MKLTPRTGWYPGSIKPVRNGWYEQQHAHGKYWKNYWRDGVWYFSTVSVHRCYAQDRPWRGLTKEVV